MNGLLRRSVFQLADLRFLLRGVRRYAPRRTVPVRDLLWHVIRVAHPRRYANRRRALAQLPPPGFRLQEEIGIATVADLPGVEAAIAEGRSIVEAIDLDRWRSSEPQNHLFTVFLGDRLDRESAILHLALHPALVAPIAHYLGMVPVLKDAVILYSPNDRRSAGSAQYLHLDGQDRRMIQVFIYLFDVDRDNGPLTAISARASGPVARSTKYRKTADTKRLCDEEALSLVPDSEVHVLTGRAGAAHLVDTDRCFHFGSREGTRPRFALVLQYYTPFAFQIPPGGEFPFARLAGGSSTEVEQMILTGR